ncbi:MAG: hypothetical protein KJ958_11740 [Gammaproteobacteria bacterium]|nr:hypothetical protein [Gammaproteobacteria bacterium]MBU1979826.1 hypothetical protein [Gammaproteobacteria bacterium]
MLLAFLPNYSPRFTLINLRSGSIIGHFRSLLDKQGRFFLDCLKSRVRQRIYFHGSIKVVFLFKL